MNPSNVFEVYKTALSNVNYLAVLIAAVVSFVLGFLWYSVLFRKPWAEATGILEESAKGANMPMVFGLSFVCSFLIALNLAVMSGRGHISVIVFNAILAALFFVAASLAIIYLFERKSLKHFLINAGYFILMFIIDGIIIGLFV